MKTLFYILTSALLISACGQRSSSSDNKLTNRTDTSVQKKEAVLNSKTISTLDSIERTNNESVIASGDKITKAYIYLQDSSINLRANIRQDHRIFGYANPDVRSERLLLLSIFTSDVENNPFGCKLGAYYDTGGMKNIILKYLSLVGEFVKANVIDESNKSTIIYFEKKWIEFEREG